MPTAPQYAAEALRLSQQARARLQRLAPRLRMGQMPSSDDVDGVLVLITGALDAFRATAGLDPKKAHIAIRALQDAAMALDAVRRSALTGLGAMQMPAPLPIAFMAPRVGPGAVTAMTPQGVTTRFGQPVPMASRAAGPLVQRALVGLTVAINVARELSTRVPGVSGLGVSRDEFYGRIPAGSAASAEQRAAAWLFAKESVTDGIVNAVAVAGAVGLEAARGSGAARVSLIGAFAYLFPKIALGAAIVSYLTGRNAESVAAAAYERAREKYGALKAREGQA